jgi:hypothetical protein
VIDCSAGQRKHDLAEEYLAKTTVTQGLFLVLVGRAQAPVWDVSARHHIERKKPMPYVNHYSFHILDADWGHLTIKISGHPPFPAQIILNGHEYVAWLSSGWSDPRIRRQLSCPCQDRQLHPRKPTTPALNQSALRTNSCRTPLYSITSSATASHLSGIVRSSAFAVLRLITSSNFVDCMTGRSAGFSPFRTRPV